MPETDVAGTDEASEGSGVTASADAPYRAEAVRDGGRWHLTVQGLDEHPDRGEVDALVVTVTPRAPGDDIPVADLDRVLDQCGFARDGEWARAGARWTAPCRHLRTEAAPPAPPPG
jgi:hypothetical protein